MSFPYNLLHYFLLLKRKEDKNNITGKIPIFYFILEKCVFVHFLFPCHCSLWAGPISISLVVRERKEI
jgi:hypothetical protein